MSNSCPLFNLGKLKSSAQWEMVHETRKESIFIFTWDDKRVTVVGKARISFSFHQLFAGPSYSPSLLSLIVPAIISLFHTLSSPPCSDAQLEQNAKNRRPSLSPIVLRQQEKEHRAKMAANAPVDITQVMSKLSKTGKEVSPCRRPPPPAKT